MNNFSGFGTSILVTASNTFPVPFAITQFTDESDPIQFDNLTIAEARVGINGDISSGAIVNLITCQISLVANSVDDVALTILFEANRAEHGKSIANDKLTFVVAYPNNKIVTLREGVFIGGDPANTLTSGKGLIKYKTYSFSFGKKVG